ncbi:hypothetical protein CEXT_743271 [Caerostris extrusa]|uniref:Uncharacterized protein n=1 Tax=Caerostris extrusa TaxID=172846 RepID=A0AAV4VTD5_CAEEX|nr:hypothetical protein CEXT_743271 [Caerostris extrusa]
MASWLNSFGYSLCLVRFSVKSSLKVSIPSAVVGVRRLKGIQGSKSMFAMSHFPIRLGGLSLFNHWFFVQFDKKFDVLLLGSKTQAWLSHLSNKRVQRTISLGSAIPD